MAPGGGRRAGGRSQGGRGGKLGSLRSTSASLLTLSFPWGGAQSELDCKLHNKSAAEEEAMKQALSELS